MQLTFLSPALHRSSTEHREPLLSESSHRPLEAQHKGRVYPLLPHGASKKSSMLFAVNQSVDADRHSAGVWRTFITNSIHLLVNRTCTVCLCGVAGLRAIGKEYILLFLEILYAPPSSFPYVSLYINWNLSLSLTDSIYTSVQRPNHNGKVQSLNSNRGFWVDWNLFYWHPSFWETYREEGV